MKCSGINLTTNKNMQKNAKTNEKKSMTQHMKTVTVYEL